MQKSQQVVAPTLAQRQLAQRLRAARQVAGKSQEDAAVGLDCDVSKIYRIETCRTVAKLSDVKNLAALYGIEQQQTYDLERLARGAKNRGWTEPYLNLIPSTLSMLGDLESVATSIDAYCVEVLHGLLQTPSYARHIIRLTDLPDARQRTLLNFRLDRQKQVFSRRPTPSLRFVIHEAALRAQAGPPTLMAEQLDHLRSLEQDATADIRVWTSQMGVHPWMSGAFTVHSFGADDLDVAYLENLVEGKYFETPQALEKFRFVFHQIRNQAIPLEEYA
jgi:transcriptional regulator with XRE-family HTH domain